MSGPNHEHDGEIEDLVANLRVYGSERAAPQSQAAVIYVRVSSERQESIPVQLEQCRRYAARLGLVIHCEESDEESGLITTRPGYRRLLDYARSGAISHVIVFHSSRWGREPGEYLTAAAQLERVGVELHATTLGRIDPGLAWVHAGVANMEVRNISAHVLPSMIARAAGGQEMGKARFGYRRTLQTGVREPDPLTFPIVQALFARYAAGETLYAVTAWFNEQTGLHKRTFGVKRMLQDPYYAGVFVWNQRRNSKVDGQYLKPRDEWVRRRHPHPAVAMATWTVVQARLAGNRNIGQDRAAGPQYPLTGLIWCVACAKRMHGQPDETGRYPFYHCPYCGKSKSVRKVDRALRGLLADVPIGADAVARALQSDLARSQQTHEARAGEVAARIGRLRERRTRLTTLYGDGAITPSDYAAAIAATEDELRGLLAEQDATTTGPASTLSMAATIRWLSETTSLGEILDDGTIAEQNEAYRHLVTSVTIDHAVLTLHVRWTPALTRLRGPSEDLVSLVFPPKRLREKPADL